MLIATGSKMSAGTEVVLGSGPGGKTFWATRMAPIEAVTPSSIEAHTWSFQKPARLLVSSLLSPSSGHFVSL